MRSNNPAARARVSVGASDTPGTRIIKNTRRARSTSALTLFAALTTLIVTLAGCSLFPTNATTLGSEKYAVIVGINDYPNLPSGNQLNYCIADATAIYNMLKAAGWDAHLYTDATKSTIEAALASVPAGQDSFVFYYSGHGDSGTSESAYIVPSDFDGATYGSMISTSELSGWLASVSSTNKSVILDSCYSGAFIGSSDTLDSAYDYTVDTLWSSTTYLQKSSAATMFFRFGDLLAQNAASASKNPSDAPLVISAAGWNATSREEGSPYNHGIFTYYFLQAAQTNSTSGFMKGDADKDGVLSLLEAYHYAEVKLEAQVNQFGFVPHISGGLRDFALIDDR